MADRLRAPSTDIESFLKQNEEKDLAAPLDGRGAGGESRVGGFLGDAPAAAPARYSVP